MGAVPQENDKSCRLLLLYKIISTKVHVLRQKAGEGRTFAGIYPNAEVDMMTFNTQVQQKVSCPLFGLETGLLNLSPQALALQYADRGGRGSEPGSASSPERRGRGRREAAVDLLESPGAAGVSHAYAFPARCTACECPHRFRDMGSGMVGGWRKRVFMRCEQQGKTLCDSCSGRTLCYWYPQPTAVISPALPGCCTLVLRQAPLRRFGFSIDGHGFPHLLQVVKVMGGLMRIGRESES